jgi:hypothetical protein
MFVRTAPLSEIRLSHGQQQVVQVGCPQDILVRLQHFLISRGFKCGVARIIGLRNQHVRSIVSFEIETNTLEEVTYAIRIFLSATKLKFIERSNDIETVFRLVNKTVGR